MINNYFDKVILDKLRCVHCEGFHILNEKEHLRCSSCGVIYPLREGRFPDFLTEQQRLSLQKELEFWHRHFGNTVYQDESEASYYRWAQLIQADPDDEIIELGCGSGALLTRIQARVKIGLEPAVGLLKKASGFWGIVGTVENLPFRDETFNTVYFKHSLHHVDDKQQGFSEAVRITKPGGRIIAIEPNTYHPQRLLISNPNSFFRKCWLIVGFIDPQESFISAKELEAIAKNLGVTCDQVIFTESLYDQPSFRQRLQNLYSFLFKSFLPNRIIYPNYLMSFRKIDS